MQFLTYNLFQKIEDAFFQTDMVAVMDACTEEKNNYPTGSSVDLLDEADEQAFMSQSSSQLAGASLLVLHKYGTVFKEYLS